MIDVDHVPINKLNYSQTAKNNTPQMYTGYVEIKAEKIDYFHSADTSQFASQNQFDRMSMLYLQVIRLHLVLKNGMIPLHSLDG